MPYLEVLLKNLIARDELVLKDGASFPALLVEIQARLLENQTAVKVGEWLGRALMASDLVEELYLSDKELYQRLCEL